MINKDFNHDLPCHVLPKHTPRPSLGEISWSNNQSSRVKMSSTKRNSASPKLILKEKRGITFTTCGTRNQRIKITLSSTIKSKVHKGRIISLSLLVEQGYTAVFKTSQSIVTTPYRQNILLVRDSEGLWVFPDNPKTQEPKGPVRMLHDKEAFPEGKISV